MGRFIQGIRIGIKKAIARKQKQIVGKLYSLLPIYYTKLSKIKLDRWFDVMNGNLSALNKFNIKFVPLFFNEIYVNMTYQMEHLDLTLLKLKADYIVLNSMYVRTDNKGIKFKADSLKKEILKKESENLENKGISLNDFVDFIEICLDSIGKINPSKISASRGYSLFDKAKKKAELIKKKNKHVNIRK